TVAVVSASSKEKVSAGAEAVTVCSTSTLPSLRCAYPSYEIVRGSGSRAARGLSLSTLKPRPSQAPAQSRTPVPCWGACGLDSPGTWQTQRGWCVKLPFLVNERSRNDGKPYRPRSSTVPVKTPFQLSSGPPSQKRPGFCTVGRPEGSKSRSIRPSSPK